MIDDTNARIEHIKKFLLNREICHKNLDFILSSCAGNNDLMTNQIAGYELAIADIFSDFKRFKQRRSEPDCYFSDGASDSERDF